MQAWRKKGPHTGWQYGSLYSFDIGNYTDNGAAIRRVRSWPHIINSGKRVVHNQFIADIEPGTILPPQANPPPKITLRWSDDKGKTYGNGVSQKLGNTGEYLTQPSWRRLGLARDRVYEVSWSENCEVALNGAFLDTTPLGT